MKVNSKRSKYLFRGRKVLPVQRQLRNSDETGLKSANPREMTSIEDAMPTALKEPVGGNLQDSDDESTTISQGPDDFSVPELFTSSPPIRDELVTETSLSQAETAEHCLSFHAGTTGSLLDLNSHGVPRLNQEGHLRFLSNAIQNAKHIAYDALRPWVIYWSLTGLSVLGADLAEWRDSVLETCAPMQNASGGFGGGHGQTSHVAPSYAVVLSLAMVGGTDTLDLIDRRAL